MIRIINKSYRAVIILLAVLAAVAVCGAYASPSFAGDLLVSSFLNNRILRFDRETGHFFSIFAENEALEGPTGMVFGPEGDLYVAGRTSNNVVRFNGQSGEFIDVPIPAAVDGLGFPTSLIFGPDGYLYIASSTRDAVLRYDSQTGAFIDVFTEGNGLEEPSGMAFGPDGNLYVSSRGVPDAILRYEGQTGAFIDVFAGDDRLEFPAGLAFGPDGHLYVASEVNNNVVRFDGQTGVFIDRFVPPGSGGLTVATDLVFGADTSLYVTSYETDEVLRYDGSTGTFVEAFVNAGSGGLDGPEQLAFIPEGLIDGVVGTAGGSIVDLAGSGASFSITSGLLAEDTLGAMDLFNPPNKAVPPPGFAPVTNYWNYTLSPNPGELQAPGATITLPAVDLGGISDPTPVFLYLFDPVAGTLSGFPPTPSCPQGCSGDKPFCCPTQKKCARDRGACCLLPPSMCTPVVGLLDPNSGTATFPEVYHFSSFIAYRDTESPGLILSTGSEALWPPDNKMVNVGLSIEATDNFDPEPEIVIHVTSDEATSTASGAGGPQHAPDALVTDDSQVLLRAERSGQGDGRAYIITVTVTDLAGNSTTSSLPVTVNLHQGQEAVDSGQSFDATEIN